MLKKHQYVVWGESVVADVWTWNGPRLSCQFPDKSCPTLVFCLFFCWKECSKDQGTNIYHFTMKDGILAHLPQCSVPGERGSGLSDLMTWLTFSFFFLSQPNVHLASCGATVHSMCMANYISNGKTTVKGSYACRIDMSAVFCVKHAR